MRHSTTRSTVRRFKSDAQRAENGKRSPQARAETLHRKSVRRTKREGR